MKTIQLFLAAVLALAALQAQARAPVPIVNHENVQVVRASGKTSAADVEKAIRAAAVATGRKWAVTQPRPGMLVATYSVRTHTVVTEIQYSASTYSVRYKDSINMKYVPGEGAGSIHPFYNQWVDEFMQAIRVELGRS